MKITVQKNVDVEVVVHLTAEQITEALQGIERDAVAFASDPEATERSKAFLIGQFVTATWQCLLGVTNEMIATLPADHRIIIAEALEREATRFRKHTAPVPGANK